MKLIYLIYISKAATAMTDDDLLQLLDVSRVNNNAHGITGMLLYIRNQQLSAQGEGRFMQVLEGAENDVKYIFDKIKDDSRHYNVMVLNEGAITKRHFKTWSMGFEAMDMEEYLTKPGYFDLNNEFLKKRSEQQFNVPLNFLKSFYMMGLGKAG